MEHLRSKLYVRILACLGAVLFCASGLFSQSTFGTFTGAISDPSSAVIKGAVVEVKNESTNVSRSTLTGSEGVYRVVNLDPGVYTITVSAQGFTTSARRNVTLPARETIVNDLQLAVAGGTATTVEVRESVVSDALTQSDSKTGTEIDSLALNFRATANPSPIVVANLAPSVVPDPSGNISISGQLPTATSFSLDGLSTQNVRNGGPNKDMFPSVESIAEFRVNSSGNSAEYSQPTDITAVSKSGGNAFHGAGFWFVQQQNWNSPDALTGNINNGDANSYGATLSGPILKNKTFFLFTYEGVQLTQNTSIQTYTVPTEWRTGNFSQSGQTILDPYNGEAPLHGGIVPAAEINPVSTKILSTFFPAPTLDSPSLSSRNFNQLFPGSYGVDGYDGRIDHNFTPNQKVFFRVTNKQVSSVGTAGNTEYDPVLGADTQGSALANYAGSYNWIITPTLVNELRAGYTAANYTYSYPLANQGNSIMSSLGIQGLPGAPKNGLGGVPVFYFPSLFGGNTNPVGHPRINDNGVLEINDNISWIKGQHTLKAGFEFRRLNYRDNITFLDGDEYGDYFFSGAFTGGGTDAHALAGMLLGIVDQTEFAQNGPDGKPYGYHYGGFVQDEWRLRRNVVLTAGLRYEVNTPFNDATNQLGNFDRNYPGGRLVVQGQQGLASISPAWKAQVEQLFNVPFVTNSQVGLPDTLRYTYYGNIQPRLGLAYNFDSKTTFRAGSGFYSVPVLGAVLYSLLGVDTSNFAGFTSSAASPLIFPNVFPSGSAANPGIPAYRRANDYNLKDPRVIQWNASFDREIGSGTLARISYVGSHTYNLIYSPDLNQVQPNTVGYAALTATPALRLQNLKYPAFSDVLTRDNGPSAKYEAVTLELNRRFSRNLNFTNSYTIAHNDTNALGVAPNSNIPMGGQGDNGGNVNNYYNIAADTGNAVFTPRQRFVNTLTYDLPFGRNQKYGANAGRGANLVIGGWRVTGITVDQTGPFLTPYFTGGDPSGTDPTLRSVSQQRPDVVSGVSAIPSSQGVNNWFNGTAFSIPGNNIGRFGNAGTGILEGPATNSFSASFGKNFNVTERIGLHYEAQFANLFNVQNYSAPTMQLGSDFGKIHSLQSVQQGGPRTIQMALRLFF